MADKSKLETVLEDPESQKIQSQEGPEIQLVNKGKVLGKTVKVDIQLPIITEFGNSRESSRENSAVRADDQNGPNDLKSKDENNNQTQFLDKVTENSLLNDHNDLLYREFSRTDTMLSKASSVRIPSPRRPNSRHKNKAKKQPRSKSSAGFTKKELELFLPRKTFFNAHDKELKEAGYHVDSTEERKKPNWRKILKMHTMEELYPPDIKPEEPTPAFNVDNESDDEDEVDANPLDGDIKTAVGSTGIPIPVKPKKTKKKALSNEKEEYKPLYDYLKYIQEHPDEYKTMSKYTPKNLDHRHPNNMVRLGRAYRRWHHGTQKYSIYQHALNNLKTTPEPETKRSQVTRRDTIDAGDQTPVPEESEIEKLRNKTEKWLRSLPTAQQLKYKELALKDVGDEDSTISKWWTTFRSCKYIRVPQHLSSI